MKLGFITKIKIDLYHLYIIFCYKVEDTSLYQNIMCTFPLTFNRYMVLCTVEEIPLIPYYI